MKADAMENIVSMMTSSHEDRARGHALFQTPQDQLEEKPQHTQFPCLCFKRFKSCAHLMDRKLSLDKVEQPSEN